jgi:hypothetical protein
MAGACYLTTMSKTPERMIAGFTTGQRDYIRREQCTASIHWRTLKR